MMLIIIEGGGGGGEAEDVTQEGVEVWESKMECEFMSDEAYLLKVGCWGSRRRPDSARNIDVIL